LLNLRTAPTVRLSASWRLTGLALLSLVGVAIAQSTGSLTQVVHKATPTITTTSTADPASYGQTVTFTATLTAAMANTATGTVQWFDGATAIGSPVSVSAAKASLSLNSLSGGLHNLAAQYSGDNNFNGATSANLAETIQQVAPGTHGFPAVVVASNLNPSIYQNNVTFTTTAPVSATGTVSILDGATTLATIPLAGGTAIYSVATLVAATHPITIVSGGDLNFLSATSTPVAQVVNKAPTVESITASPVTGSTVGSNVTFTALVNTGMLTPTGTVTFSDGATSLGTAAVTAVTATNLIPFSADFTQWTPDANGSTATVGSPVLGPDGAVGSATAITYPVTTGGNYAGLKTTGTGSFASLPTVVSFWAQATAGTTITVNLTDGNAANLQTATQPATGTWQRIIVPLTLPAGASANAILSIGLTGQVAGTVNLYGVQFEQAATAGVYVLTNGASTSGQGGLATFASTALLDGSHPISATYSGDTNYLGGTGGLTAPLSVGKAAPLAVVSSSSLISNYGSPVTFTATVTGPDTTPTGNVTFYDGATAIGTGTLDVTGNATFTISSLVVGTHPISVQYGGDSNFTPITSAAITQTVVSVAATVSVTSTSNPSTYGDSITFNVVLVGSGAIPTGTVTITDGASTLGTEILTNGTASLTIDTLTAGSHNISVTYSGDSNYSH
jgi:hypothetical protein